MAATVLVRPSRRDLVVAGGFVIAGLVELLSRHLPSPVDVVLGLPGALLLGCVAWRRTRPLLALTVLAAGAALGTLLEMAVAPAVPGSGDATVPIFALILLTYSLGAHGSRRELGLGVFVPVVLVTGIDLSSPSSFSLPAALLFFCVFVVGAPVLAGRLVRLRAGVVARLEEQACRLREEALAEARAARAAERLALSERLHRTLLTGVRSLAQGARRAELATGKQQQDAIGTLEADARALLSETRSVVVSLASDSGKPVGAQTPATAVEPLPSGQAAAVGFDRAGMTWMVIAVAAVALGLMFETRTGAGLKTSVAVALVACLVVALPLLGICGRPAPAVAATWAAAAIFTIAVGPLSSMFTPLSLVFLPPFAAASYAGRRDAVISLGICWVGEVAVFGPASLPANGTLSLGAWLAGRAFREATRLAGAVRANNLRLVEQGQARVRLDVLEERSRLAGEVHDSIGHALTVVALQAGAARRVWTRDPARAREALDTISRVANAALAELDVPVDGARGMGLHALDELLATAGAAGLRIEVQRDPVPAALPPDADLAAYRLVQEALTNILKHAPGSAARLTLRRHPSHLELSVRNGRGHQPQIAGDFGVGHGLQAMRQRVEACGGSLEWAHQPKGGFSVRARFPLGIAL